MREPASGGDAGFALTFARPWAFCRHAAIAGAFVSSGWRRAPPRSWLRLVRGNGAPSGRRVRVLARHLRRPHRELRRDSDDDSRPDCGDCRRGRLGVRSRRSAVGWLAGAHGCGRADRERGGRRLDAVAHQTPGSASPRGRGGLLRDVVDRDGESRRCRARGPASGDARRARVRCVDRRLARPPWSQPRRLRVTFLDVGQGEAAIVQFPDGRTLGIDAGGLSSASFDLASRVIAPAFWALGVRRLDYMSITHGDVDHIGGAASLFRDFRPFEVWEGVPMPRHGPTRELRMLADRSGHPLANGAATRSHELRRRRPLVHHPPNPEWERQRIRNDDSEVIELRSGGVSFVFTGDIGRDVERMLVNDQPS